MTKLNKNTLSERLDGYQVAQSCSEELIKMTIGDYYIGHSDKLAELLALPSSKKWNLKPSNPFVYILLTLAKDDDIYGSKDFIETNIHKALDLIIYPVASANYNLPFFRLTIKGFINFMDSVISDEDGFECREHLRKNWTVILNKSFNKTFKWLNDFDDHNLKYLWLDSMLSYVFADLNAFYELNSNNETTYKKGNEKYE